MKHLEREMILLRGYPGYDKGFVGRDVDIRLRNTNSECEIMMKLKTSEHGVAREEVSLKLQDHDLETSRKVLRGLGFTSGLKMVRTMDVYDYHGIEWQVVTTPKGLWYWEAEQAAREQTEVASIQAHLTREAGLLGLSVMTPEELQDFIHTLDTEVNVEVEL